MEIPPNTRRKHTDVANGTGANGTVVVCHDGNSNPSCPTHRQPGGDSLTTFTDICSADVSPRHQSIYHPSAGEESLVEMKKDVNEWHQVARVLDRLFFFVYLILAGFYGVLVFWTLA